jgi:hypothetical protein
MLVDLDALARNDPHPNPSDIRFYPDQLLPELQSTLAALADLEVQFEIARDSLEEWSGSEEEKRCCCAELEQARHEAREPHLRQLVRLQSGWPR